MADLKSGTTIGGNTIWSQANLPLLPTGNTLTYKGFKVYTENDKPTKAEIGLGNVTNDAQVKKAGDTMQGTLELQGSATELKLPFRIAMVRATEPYIVATRTDNNPVTNGFPSAETRTFVIHSKTTSPTSDPNAGANLVDLICTQRAAGGGAYYIRTFGAPNTTTGSSGPISTELQMLGDNGLVSLTGSQFNVGMSTTVSGNLTGTQLITKGDGNRNVEFRDANGNELAMIFADTGKNLYVRSGGSYTTRFAADGTLILANGLTAPRQIFVNGAGLPNNNALIRLDTSGDGNAVGDGATHLGVKNENGDYYHYFRGKGTAFFDMRGGISSLTPVYLNGVDQSLPKVEMVSTGATGGKNLLRKFRGGINDTIWHETVQGIDYKLSTGNTDADFQFWVRSVGGNRGGNVVSGRFTADNGNDGFKINYVPTTESAMLQIWERGTSNLNAYFGYGSANTTVLNINNRLGAINIATKDGRDLVNIQGGLSVSGNQIVMYATDPNNNSSSPIYIQNWGSVANDRPVVYEVKDNQGYLFYAQRRNNGNVEFETAGALTARNNLHVYGGQGLTIRNNGNRHVWFMDAAGNEKSVIYSEDTGNLVFRTNAGGTFVHQFTDGMLWLNTGMLAYRGDLGLVRGQISGGAWDEWRQRPAGILVDCQNSETQAYNIWKATHWGIDHIAAMGVHRGGGIPSVQMHVGGANYVWAGNGDFTAPGTVSAGNNGYFNDVYIRSDIRLKSNLIELKDALNKVEQLKGYIYDKKQNIEDKEPQYREAGLIAQDLQKVLPEAVAENNETGILTISPSSVNALLVNAINELRERMEAIERKIGA